MTALLTSYLLNLVKRPSLRNQSQYKHPCAQLLGTVAYRCHSMNQSDATQESNQKIVQQPLTKPECQNTEIDQEAIDKHMHMAARMLYDIILDWVKAQPEYAQHFNSPSAKSTASERSEP